MNETWSTKAGDSRVGHSRFGSDILEADEDPEAGGEAPIGQWCDRALGSQRSYVEDAEGGELGVVVRVDVDAPVEEDVDVDREVGDRDVPCVVKDVMEVDDYWQRYQDERLKKEAEEGGEQWEQGGLKSGGDPDGDV